MSEFPKFWEVRPKLKRVPYGYILNPDNPDECIPNPPVALLLEQAVKQIHGGAGLRTVADWLNANNPDETITHAGLKWLLGEYYTSRPQATAPKSKPRKPKTSIQRMESLRQQKIAQEKKRINNANKRIAKYGGQIVQIKQEDFSKKELVSPLEGLIIKLDDIPIEKKISPNIIFEPNPGPQTFFLESSEQEILYGGAAGGGKSYAMLADPMRYFGNKNFRGLLLRRTNDELKELKWKAYDLYDNPILKGKFKQQESVWVFPSGAQFWMTYLERDEDVKRYQGQSFTWIGVDELTQYPTPFAWDYLRSRLRSTDTTIPLSMRATSNPGGPGHGWVKRMFVDPAPANTTFWATDIDTSEVLKYPKKYQHGHPKAGQPHPLADQPLFQRKFIPAKLYDNPYLTQDLAYEASLLSLPEDQRRQLLEGDWNAAEGAAFKEFRLSEHVCKPFRIPPNWKKFRSCDYGYSSFTAVHWYAIDGEGTLYVYREHYTSKKTGKELANEILELEKDERVSYGVLDSSVWQQRGLSGPTVAEEMIAHGCAWRPSDRSKGSRAAGKHRLHELLRMNHVTGKPGIIFFDTCRQIISDLPIIPVDPDGEDDIDSRYAQDHAYDSIRYGIMSRPKAFSFWDTGPRATTSSYTPSDSNFGY